jgi:hypothetical protein
VRVFVLIDRLAHQVSQGELDAAAVRSANAVAGLFLKYPATQIQRMVDGWIAYQEEPSTVKPTVLVTGPPQKATR